MNVFCGVESPAPPTTDALMLGRQLTPLKWCRPAAERGGTHRRETFAGRPISCGFLRDRVALSANDCFSKSYSCGLQDRFLELYIGVCCGREWGPSVRTSGRWSFKMLSIVCLAGSSVRLAHRLGLCWVHVHVTTKRSCLPNFDRVEYVSYSTLWVYMQIQNVKIEYTISAPMTSWLEIGDEIIEFIR